MPNVKTITYLDKTCPICGKKFTVALRKKSQVSCSVKCRAKRYSKRMIREQKIENWKPGIITPPKQQYFRSKRFKLMVQRSIAGDVFVGSDKTYKTAEMDLEE